MNEHKKPLAFGFIKNPRIQKIANIKPHVHVLFPNIYVRSLLLHILIANKLVAQYSK